MKNPIQKRKKRKSTRVVAHGIKTPKKQIPIYGPFINPRVLKII